MEDLVLSFFHEKKEELNALYFAKEENLNYFSLYETV
jgi:hypothetical protein